MAPQGSQQTNGMAIAYALACDHPILRESAAHLVRFALKKTGSVPQAAEVLRVSKTSLYRWLEEFPDVIRWEKP
jgi:transcriptional regulator with PAS, ATPase and Fis domain